MMKHARWGVAAGALVGAMMLAQPAEAAFTSLFTGSITPSTTASAQPANGPWSDSVLSYEVFYDDSAGIGQPITWKYVYTFTDTGDIKGVSHFNVETSRNFGEENIFAGTSGVDQDGNILQNCGDDKDEACVEVKEHSGSGNPNMPEELYGIKFEFGNEGVSTYEIVTDRAPEYRDVYLKDGTVQGPGTDVTFFNAGFTSSDEDPTSSGIDDFEWLAIFQALANDGKSAARTLFDSYWTGDLSKHVLTPDTVVVNVVPIPAALPMLGAAVAGLGFAGWRRNRARA